MSEPIPVDGFEWMEDLSKIDEGFIKNFMNILKNLNDLHSDLPFLPERMKIDKCS